MWSSLAANLIYPELARLAAKRVEGFLFYSLILFLPTQFGKHMWFDFSYVVGQRVDYLSPTLYLTDVLVFLLFLISLFQKKIRVNSGLTLIVLFIAISSFAANSPMVAWYGFSKFLEVGFLVWYIAKERIRTATIGILLSCGIFFESILALAQTLHQGSVGGLLYFLGERMFVGSTPGIANASINGELILRPYGTFSHPNVMAGFFLVSMLLVLFFLNKSKNRALQSVTLLAISCGTFGLALSLSRVAIFVWVIIGAITAFTYFRKRIEKQILLILLVVLTTLILSFMFFPDILLRLSSFSFDASFSERIILSSAAFRMFFTHPLFGVGLYNFILSLPFLGLNSFILQPVHNMYLLVAAELGLPGLLLFLWFLSSLLQKQIPLALRLAFWAILVIGFFDHYFLTLQQGQLLFALVVGLVINSRVTKTQR